MTTFRSHPVPALLTALLAAALAGPALAQEAEPDTWMRLVEPRSHAARQAEDKAAADSVAQAEAAAQKAPGLTRAQVRAELAAARRSGEFDRLSAEAYDFSLPSAHAVRMARQAR